MIATTDRITRLPMDLCGEEQKDCGVIHTFAQYRTKGQNAEALTFQPFLPS